MAINYTYPVKGSPVAADEFLIIDSTDNSTKKVTASSVLSLTDAVATFTAASPLVNVGDAKDVSLTLSTVPVSKGGTGLTSVGTVGQVMTATAGGGLEFTNQVNTTYTANVATGLFLSGTVFSITDVPIANGGTGLNSTGTNTGYSLITDGLLGTTRWGIPANATESEKSQKIVQTVRFTEAVVKGDPVYIAGYSLGNGTTVAKADASNPAKMPAYGIANETVSQNTNGTITAIGSFNGTFNTSYLTQNEVIYVDIAANDVPGRPRLTSTKPAGEASLIQNIGFCSRSNANNGEIEVVAVGRANATPNLDSAKIFLGDSSNHSVARAVTGDVALSNTGVTTVNSVGGASPATVANGSALGLTSLQQYGGPTYNLTQILSLSQTEYDGLAPNYNPDALYIIVTP